MGEEGEEEKMEVEVEAMTGKAEIEADDVDDDDDSREGRMMGAVSRCCCSSSSLRCLVRCGCSPRCQAVSWV